MSPRNFFLCFFAISSILLFFNHIAIPVLAESSSQDFSLSQSNSFISESDLQTALSPFDTTVPFVVANPTSALSQVILFGTKCVRSFSDNFLLLDPGQSVVVQAVVDTACLTRPFVQIDASIDGNTQTITLPIVASLSAEFEQPAIQACACDTIVQHLLVQNTASFAQTITVESVPIVVGAHEKIRVPVQVKTPCVSSVPSGKNHTVFATIDTPFSQLRPQLQLQTASCVQATLIDTAVCAFAQKSTKSLIVTNSSSVVPARLLLSSPISRQLIVNDDSITLSANQSLILASDTSYKIHAYGEKTLLQPLTVSCGITVDELNNSIRIHFLNKYSIKLLVENKTIYEKTVVDATNSTVIFLQDIAPQLVVSQLTQTSSNTSNNISVTAQSHSIQILVSQLESAQPVFESVTWIRSSDAQTTSSTFLSTTLQFAVYVLAILVILFIIYAVFVFIQQSISQSRRTQTQTRTVLESNQTAKRAVSTTLAQKNTASKSVAPVKIASKKQIQDSVVSDRTNANSVYSVFKALQKTLGVFFSKATILLIVLLILLVFMSYTWNESQAEFESIFVKNNTLIVDMNTTTVLDVSRFFADPDSDIVSYTVKPVSYSYLNTTVFANTTRGKTNFSRFANITLENSSFSFSLNSYAYDSVSRTLEQQLDNTSSVIEVVAKSQVSVVNNNTNIRELLAKTPISVSVILSATDSQNLTVDSPVLTITTVDLDWPSFWASFGIIAIGIFIVLLLELLLVAKSIRIEFASKSSSTSDTSQLSTSSSNTSSPNTSVNNTAPTASNTVASQQSRVSAQPSQPSQPSQLSKQKTMDEMDIDELHEYLRVEKPPKKE
jgi:hypothetical protein